LNLQISENELIVFGEIQTQATFYYWDFEGNRFEVQHTTKNWANNA
jgi:hypothetical protein